MKTKEEKALYMKKWRKDNREQIKIYNKKYKEDNKERIEAVEKIYKENNKEKIKEWANIYAEKYRDDNKEKIKAKQKRYYEDNKDKFKIDNKKYYEDNKEKRKIYVKKWIEDNKEKNKKQRRIHQREKRANDPIHKIKVNLRGRLYKAVKGLTKIGSAVKDLGCTVEELKNHLENKFTENMSWDNYGKWHIDHIKPLSIFDLEDRTEFRAACHYTNLQPLWAKDNMSKGDKYFEL